MQMRLLFLVAILPIAGCFHGITICPSNCDGPVEELVVRDAKACFCKNKIAVIDVEGLILNAKMSSLLTGDGDNPVSLFRERLQAAADDTRVKAIVLRINSPGGAVTASDIMYQDLLTFRRETGKPVVACMMDVAASGGFYLAMGSDYIFAHPTTVTGSIGVIMSLYDASGLFAKIGVASNPIKSGPNKDIGNPARPMTDEERAILQRTIDQFYGQFVKVVACGRHMTEEQIRKLADGRIYTGLEAKELGLVDHVGYLEDTIAAAKSMVGIKDAVIVAYDRCDGFRGSIYAKMPKIPSEINLKLDVPGLNKGVGATFMYLWEPGTLP
jgi:protease-4